MSPSPTETAQDPLAPLLASLHSWSLGRTPPWHTSAHFARLTNSLPLSSNPSVRGVVDELRLVLESLLGGEPSPELLDVLRPQLDTLSRRLTAALAPPPPPAPALTPLHIPKRPSLQVVVVHAARLKEVLEDWREGEVGQEKVEACVEALEGAVRGLEGMDLSSVLPTLSALRAAITTLLSCPRPSPTSPHSPPALSPTRTSSSSSSSSLSSDSTSSPTPSTTDQITPLLITLLTTLKSSHTQHVNAQSEVRRRATFRLRSAVFDGVVDAEREKDDVGRGAEKGLGTTGRWPSTRGVAGLAGARAFTR